MGTFSSKRGRGREEEGRDGKGKGREWKGVEGKGKGLPTLMLR